MTKQLQSKQRKEDKQVAAKKAEETLREEKEKAVEARFKREAEEKVKAVHLEWEAKYQKLEAESLSIKREKEKLQKGLKKKLNSIRRDKDKIAEREKVQEDRERRLNILMGQQDALAGCSLAELKEWEAILEVSQRKVGEAKIKAEVAQRLAGTLTLSSTSLPPLLSCTYTFPHQHLFIFMQIPKKKNSNKNAHGRNVSSVATNRRLLCSYRVVSKAAI